MRCGAPPHRRSPARSRGSQALAGTDRGGVATVGDRLGSGRSGDPHLALGHAAGERVQVVQRFLSFRLVGEEFQYIVENCDARAFIVQDELIEAVESVRADLSVPAQNYIDVSATWRFRDSYTVRAGVNNLFDLDPPIVGSLMGGADPRFNGNTYPVVYQALGRFIFLGLTADF